MNAVNLENHLKHQFVLERIQKLGVTHSQQGQPIEKVDYKELLFELVLAEMRQVDIEHPEHKWFR